MHATVHTRSTLAGRYPHALRGTQTFGEATDGNKSLAA